MSADYLLKIDGIPGSSRREGHEDEIELRGFSWGESNQSSFGEGVGPGVGRVDVRNLTVIKVADKASPMLFNCCATGKQLSEVVLTCREQGGEQEEYLTIKLSPAVVAGFDLSGSGAKPEETISFSFERIDFTYADQGKAPVTKWYDQSKLKGG